MTTHSTADTKRQMDRIEKTVKKIESRLASLNAFETLQSALDDHKEQVAEKPLEVGDWVIRTCKTSSDDGMVARVTSVNSNYVQVDLPWTCIWCYSLGYARRATTEEIAAHLKAEREKEWAKVTELQDGDTCEERGHETFLAIHDTGVPMWTTNGDSWERARYPYWTNGCVDHINIDAKGWTINPLPLSEFLRRAKGTAERLRMEKEEKAKSRLIRGCRVMTPSGSGIYIGESGNMHHCRFYVHLDGRDPAYALCDNFRAIELTPITP